MTKPMNPDELARHLYVRSFDHAGATDEHRQAWAAEWDTGVVKPDVAEYLRTAADKLITEGQS
jgi:hypothetical protein